MWKYKINQEVEKKSWVNLDSQPQILFCFYLIVLPTGKEKK